MEPTTGRSRQTAADFDWTELEKQKADSNSIYNHYKTMLAIPQCCTQMYLQEETEAQLQFPTQMAMK